MVIASLSCAWLFQDWARRSWKLASLTVLRPGRSSEIQSSKTQWTKCNWKRRRHLFWYWRTFLATIRPETTQNSSITGWLLSENWAATWDALPIFTYGKVSWEPGSNEWRAEWEIPSGPERDGDQVSWSLGRIQDGWLLLESEESPPCRWAF